MPKPAKNWDVIANSVPAAIWYVAPDGSVMRVNDETCRQVGLPRESIEGRNISEIFKESGGQFCANYARVAETGVPEIGSLEKYIGRNGDARWSFCNKIPQKDRNGRTIGIVIMSIDMTDEKNAEADAERSSQTYRMLFDSISSGVAVYKPVDQEGSDFMIVDLNKAGEDIDGIVKDKIIGRRLTDAFPGAEKFGLLRVMRSVLASGIPQRHPSSLYKDDRIEGWRENYVYRLPSGEIVAIYDDVTEKQKTAARITSYIKSARLLKGIVDSSTAVAVQWSMDEGSVISYISDNSAAVGIDRGAVLNGKTSWESVVHPDDRQGWREGVSVDLESGAQKSSRQYRIVTNSGRTAWVREDRTVVRNNGDAPTAESVVVDVTDQHEKMQASETEKRSISKANQILSVQAEITKGLLGSGGSLKDVLACIGRSLKFRSVAVYMQEAGIVLAECWSQNGDAAPSLKPIESGHPDAVMAFRKWILSGKSYVGEMSGAPSALAPIAAGCSDKAVVIPISVQSKPKCAVFFGYRNGRTWSDEELGAMECIAGLVSLLAVGDAAKSKVMRKVEETVVEINGIFERMNENVRMISA